MGRSPKSIRYGQHVKEMDRTGKFSAKRNVLPCIVQHLISSDSHENLITGYRTQDSPKETIGGILADDMGLGKTLTVISTIIRTAGPADCFARQGRLSTDVSVDNSTNSGLTFSKATLVIVPSPRMTSVHIQ